MQSPSRTRGGAEQSTMPEPPVMLPPLCVDMDNSLLLIDTLWVSCKLLCRRQPLAWPGLCLALLRGRPAFKARLAELVTPDPAELPYNLEVLEFLKAEKATGRRLFLVTGAHQSIASSVARHVGLFEAAYGTTDGCNLTASRKAAFLVEQFGEHGFDYVGDCRKDLPVWARARQALVVARSPGIADAAARVAKVGRVFQR